MEFQPTYLYIKQHSVTKKCYFGKTIRDPEIYKGSGTHWKRHIAAYGENLVETLWFCLFLSKEDIRDFAVMFSTAQDIVNSKDWLNLRVEDGLEGGKAKGTRYSPEARIKVVEALIKRNKSPEIIAKNTAKKIGRKHSEEHKIRIGLSSRGKILSKSTREKLSIAHTGKKLSEATRRKLSEINTGKTISAEHYEKLLAGRLASSKQVECPHCGKIGEKRLLTRYHFSNCTKITGIKHKGTSIIRPKVTCPHCNKVGGSNLMKRYHYDNCKYKPND
jgi:endogenous inhibitor of DNA gyrase (YacG/DUF329 family)